MLAFTVLICKIIYLINTALMAYIILGLLIHFDIVNRYNQVVSRIYSTLDGLFEPILGRIRRQVVRYLPNLGGIDISPIIFWLLLDFVRTTLLNWSYVHPLVSTASN
jgi:YggT family protein